MPTTSGTYNFQSIQVEILIREAFERIGILGEFVEPQKLDSAKRSINLLLLSWMEETINLWTLQGAYLPLVTGQRQYILPNIVSNIIQANLRTSTRQLNGTPQTNTANTYDNGGGGVAGNAFDGNPTTACTQNVANGNISYDYGLGVTQYITFIGIQSDTTTLYSLVVESCPLDPAVLASWTPLITILPQTFQAGVNTWFDVPTPVNARAYRIRETGGATLNMQEIYFNNNTFDFARNIEELGLRVRFTKIIPAQNKVELQVYEKPQAAKDWLVFKSIEFPYINLYWAGTIVMVIGFIMSILRRKKEVNAK